MVAAHYKKDDLLNCWTSSSDISGYHADFHEGHGTVGAWQGHGKVCELIARHGREWHGHGMLCVNWPSVDSAPYKTQKCVVHTFIGAPNGKRSETSHTTRVHSTYRSAAVLCRNY